MIRLSPLRPFTLGVLAAAGLASPSLQAQSSAEATFAGGCFWCMEPPYDNQPGVSATISGYIGGELENPTYEEISQGGTGHAEVVQIEYDSEQISYEQLLEIFWRNIDPFAVDRQKNPVRYKFYRYSCGRDGRLEEVWGEEAGGPSFE